MAAMDLSRRAVVKVPRSGYQGVGGYGLVGPTNNRVDWNMTRKGSLYGKCGYECL